MATLILGKLPRSFFHFNACACNVNVHAGGGEGHSRPERNSSVVKRCISESGAADYTDNTATSDVSKRCFIGAIPFLDTFLLFPADLPPAIFLLHRRPSSITRGTRASHCLDETKCYLCLFQLWKLSFGLLTNWNCKIEM